MSTATTARSTWSIDPVHSTVEFAVSHMGITTFRGRFRTVAGTLNIDEESPANSSVIATIEAASIDVPGDRFAGHMKGDDFLNVEHYPTLTFRSNEVERVDDTHWRVAGDLTIRDATRPVTFDTEYLGQAKHPFSGKTSAGFRAEAEIDRNDFGISWNALLESGAKYVGERVRIILDIEAVRQD